MNTEVTRYAIIKSSEFGSYEQDAFNNADSCSKWLEVNGTDDMIVLITKTKIGHQYGEDTLNRTCKALLAKDWRVRYARNHL